MCMPVARGLPTSVLDADQSGQKAEGTAGRLSLRLVNAVAAARHPVSIRINGKMSTMEPMVVNSMRERSVTLAFYSS